MNNSVHINLTSQMKRTISLKNTKYFLCLELWSQKKKKRCVEFLIPSTSECEYIGKQSHCRFKQVKMRSLVWALIQYHRCPYKNGKFGHTHTERRDMKRQGESRVMRNQRLELYFCKQRTIRRYQKLEKPRKDPSLTSFRGTLPTS